MIAAMSIINMTWIAFGADDESQGKVSVSITQHVPDAITPGCILFCVPDCAPETKMACGVNPQAIDFAGRGERI